MLWFTALPPARPILREHWVVVGEVGDHGFLTPRVAFSPLDGLSHSSNIVV